VTPFEIMARLVGVFDSETALIGPETVQIDLTDSCPNNCIGCWARSPFLRPHDHYDGLARGELEFDAVVRLLDELAELKVSNIFLGGGGEPFAHPQIMRVIEEAKKRKFLVTINTNFILLDPHKIEWLFSLGPDFLIISLWAATPETYARCHPNQTPGTFDRVVANVKHLQQLKRAHQRAVPAVKLYQVICNANYHEIASMAWLGHKLGVESVEYAAFDPIPDRTEQFLPRPREIVESLSAIDSIKDNSMLPKIDHKLFTRRLRHPGAPQGDYDNGIYFNLHCYAGWFFARITTVGEFHSCLKSHRIPIGNIHQTSFKKLWNSELQREFRRHTFKIDVNDPYLKRIGHDINYPLPGCFRICDNIGQNELMEGYWQNACNSKKELLTKLHEAAREGKSLEELEMLYAESVALEKASL